MILGIKFTLATFVRSLRLCRESGRVGARFAMVLVAVLVGLVGLGAAAPTRSTTIALTSDERRLVVVNREANSVSII